MAGVVRQHTFQTTTFLLEMVNKAGTLEMSPSIIFIHAVNLLQLRSKGVKVIVHRSHITTIIKYHTVAIVVRFISKAVRQLPPVIFFIIFYFIFKIQY